MLKGFICNFQCSLLKFLSLGVIHSSIRGWKGVACVPLSGKNVRWEWLRRALFPPRNFAAGLSFPANKSCIMT